MTEPNPVPLKPSDSQSLRQDRKRTNLPYAQDLAAKGFRVFRYHPVRDGRCACKKPNCGAAGKHPLQKGWQELATNDLDTIRKWWTETPDAEIGINTFGLLIIDVDGSEAHARLERFQQEHGRLPKTFRVNSGNSKPDHFQLYFRSPPGFAAKNKPLLERVDIKSGIGGQVAAPGNMHKSGNCYTWDFDEAQGEPDTLENIPEAPACITEAVELVPEARTPQEALEARKSQKKSSRRMGSDTFFEPGTDGELLHALEQRFPILEFGTRRSVCLQAVSYLLATRKLSAHQCQSLLTEHLFVFQENYEADLETALEEMRGMVSSLQKKIRQGNFQQAVDHNQLAADQDLCPALADYFTTLAAKDPRTPYAYGVRHGYSRFTETEQQFIHALLLRYQYEVFYHQNPNEFRFVESQIMAVMDAKFGKSVGRTKFAELKNKFFGGKKLRGGNRSPALELFRCIEPAGVRGEASVFVPVNVPKLNLDELELTNVETREEAEARRAGGRIDGEAGRPPAGNQSAQLSRDPAAVSGDAGLGTDRGSSGPLRRRTGDRTARKHGPAPSSRGNDDSREIRPAVLESGVASGETAERDFRAIPGGTEGSAGRGRTPEMQAVRKRDRSKQPDGMGVCEPGIPLSSSPQRPGDRTKKKGAGEVEKTESRRRGDGRFCAAETEGPDGGIAADDNRAEGTVNAGAGGSGLAADAAGFQPVSDEPAAAGEATAGVEHEVRQPAEPETVDSSAGGVRQPPEIDGVREAEEDVEVSESELEELLAKIEKFTAPRKPLKVGTKIRITPDMGGFLP